jgi:hypothetical protein
MIQIVITFRTYCSVAPNWIQKSMISITYIVCLADPNPCDIIQCMCHLFVLYATYLNVVGSRLNVYKQTLKNLDV